MQIMHSVVTEQGLHYLLGPAFALQEFGQDKICHFANTFRHTTKLSKGLVQI